MQVTSLFNFVQWWPGITLFAKAQQPPTHFGGWAVSQCLQSGFRISPRLKRPSQVKMHGLNLLISLDNLAEIKDMVGDPVLDQGNVSSVRVEVQVFHALQYRPWITGTTSN